jgi:NTE family protein
MMSNIKKIPLVLFISLVIFSSPFSQENYFEDPPKIGLALGGGAAKGFAHVGVLKILDSLNIPISYIAGTSMGAVVGGMYAAGYSAQQLDSIVQLVDWSSIFSDKPTRDKLSFLEKWDTGRFQIPLSFNNFKIEPPTGLIAGQKVSILFSRHLLPVCEVTNFDSLVIPFRCIAADLISGQEVVLKKGALDKAIRASMSVPSIFTPVEWGDSLLVDGGVINNLPVDILKKMGANYIIAVNVALHPKSREELNNAFQIFRQSFSLSQNLKEMANLQEANIAINPNLKNYSIADFENKKISEMIRIGENAARERVHELKKLVFTGIKRHHHLTKSQFPQGIVHGIQISGNKILPFSFIYQLLGINPTKELDIDLLERRINSLYGLGYFETINYQVSHHSENSYTIHLKVKEKKQNLVRLGLRYQEDKKIIGAVNLIQSDFPFVGIRNEISFLFSGLILFEWELSTPRRMFGGQILPYVNIFHRDIFVNIFENRSKVARYHKRSSGSAVGLGFSIGKLGIIKTEYIGEKLGVIPSIASSEGRIWSEWKHNLHTGRLYAEIDQLSDPLIPQNGFKMQIQYEQTLNFLKQPDNFQRFYLKYNSYFSLLPKVTTSLHLFMGLSKNSPLYGHFFLGGGESFIGMNYDEFAGPNLGLYRIDNYFKISGNVSIGAILNGGNIWQNYKDIDFTQNFYLGYGLGIRLNTIIGPINYTIGTNDNKEFHYITFGFNLTTRNDERM